MQHNEPSPEEFSLKNYFVPLTNAKAITWIVIIGLIVFCNSLFNGFVGDDLGQVVNNPAIQSLVNIPKFFLGGTFYNGASTILAGSYYRPFLSIVYTLIYTFFGLTPFAFHFIQLLIHIVNAIFVFLIFRYFFKKNISFLLALLFLVHPIQTEAVDYIADLEDVLFFLFGSIAFYLELKLKTSTKKLLSVGILLFCSILSKETGILFIVSILSYHYLFSKREIFKKSSIFYFCLILFYLLLRLLLVHQIILNSPYTQISQANIGTRLLTFPLILLYYLQKIIFPMHFAINQSWLFTTQQIANFYSALLIDIVFVLTLLWLGKIIYKKYKEYLKTYILFVIWFSIGIVFHSQIFFVLDFTVSDRWFYFLFIGLLGIVGIIMQSFFTKKEKVKQTFYIVMGVVFVILSVISVTRNTNFHDQYSLLSHDVKYSSDSNMFSAFALELIKNGQTKEAYSYLQEAIQADPKGYLDWNDLGSYYTDVGNIKKAEAAYKIATINAPYYLAYENEATLYFLYEKPQIAENYVKDALNKFPTDGTLWYIYTLVENKLGNKDLALIGAKTTLIYYPEQDISYKLYYGLTHNLSIIYRFVPTTEGYKAYICIMGCS